MLHHAVVIFTCGFVTLFKHGLRVRFRKLACRYYTVAQLGNHFPKLALRRARNAQCLCNILNKRALVPALVGLSLAREFGRPCSFLFGGCICFCILRRKVDFFGGIAYTAVRRRSKARFGRVYLAIGSGSLRNSFIYICAFHGRVLFEIYISARRVCRIKLCILKLIVTLCFRHIVADGEACPTAVFCIFLHVFAYTGIDRGIPICYSAIKPILGARRQLELIEFKPSLGSVFIWIYK